MDAEALLSLWERALAAPPALRADGLLGDEPALTLGQRNIRLAQVHRRLFGRRIELLSHCPACGETAQFEADSEALAALPAARETHHEHAGIAFRLPRAEDLAAVASLDEQGFAEALLSRCVEGQVLPLQTLDALSQRMEALDPAASLSFALECPACGQRWDAPLDLASLVWRKLQAAAEALLLDVDTLARQYGWTEREVLALSPTRRAAYLQMAGA